MPELPQSLQNRFLLYLNILPVLEKVGMYGGMMCGIALTIYSITRAALKLSTTLTVSRNISSGKYKSSAIYNACEETLMSGNECKPKTKMRKSKNNNNTEYVNMNEKDEEMHIIESVIGRCDFELENEAALSDIEYDEIDEDDEHSYNKSLIHSIEDTTDFKVLEQVRVVKLNLLQHVFSNGIS